MLVSLCKANRDEYITGITPAGIIAALHSTMRFFETHCTRWQHVFYMDPALFYYTKTKELRGGIITDKENYFIALQPVPFPPKPEGRKLKEDLELKLANNEVYKLKHFDTRYMDNDSAMQLMYLIDMKDVEDFLKFETTEAKIDMKGTEGIRTYVFKLHKNAIQEQLKCFLKKEDEK